MFLYNVTLQPGTSVHQCVYGNFSAPKAQEIAVGKGKRLELLRPDESGRVHVVAAHECFGEIRSLQPLRITGG